MRRFLSTESTPVREKNTRKDDWADLRNILKICGVGTGVSLRYTASAAKNYCI
jgi:hypothetical protein